LYLAGNDTRDAGLAVLAGSDCFPALRLLDLRENHFGSDGLHILARSPALQDLRHLWLVDNWIGDSGLTALCDAGVSRMPHLESLWLNWNSVGNRGAAALARDPARTALRDLDLRDCHLEDEGGLALAHSPWLGELDILQLSGNRFSTATVRALRERFGRRARV
jgi:Ran GTPase-activating protein (RanGAP) involved in mRNA processing and transport